MVRGGVRWYDTGRNLDHKDWSPVEGQLEVQAIRSSRDHSGVEQDSQSPLHNPFEAERGRNSQTV
jgi:hypothetical protein